MPPRRHVGPALLRPTMAGLLNADASSDAQARQRVGRLFGSILALLFVVDITCALIVVVWQCQGQDEEDSTLDNDAPSLTWLSNATDSSSSSSSSTAQCVGHSLHHPLDSSMNDETFGDLFWMSVVRAVITTALLALGIHAGQRRHNSENHVSSSRNHAPPTTTTTTATSSTVPSSAEGQQDLTEPLLGNNESESTTSTTNQLANQGNETHEASNPPPAPSSWSTCRVQCNISPERIKSLALVTLFLTSTLYQVYAGLQVSLLDPGHVANTAVTCLLCLTVLWINVQAYVFRVILAEFTRDAGLFLPATVHRHPMYYCQGVGLSFHSCDLCHQGIAAGSSSGNDDNNNNEPTGCYRCSLCDFDVCLKCAKRSDAATVGENVLRGDRGVRAETALTTKDYIQRSIHVAGRELPLLLLSFILLATSSVSRLLLPHFQGHIIDKVIPNAEGEYDKDGFVRFIQIYIGIMVAQGALSTLYSAIFTLVSRRLQFTIRNALLEKILHQDVAYFDGTESGRLISRLTNDLQMMMQPIQSSLSSLLSNALILIGGLVMCFAKSYRLSMLAFVAVGPISYLWEQYAQWSKGLAREMLSQWAEGNSIASQALSHIRTVKAFGCEDRVLEKYSATNKRALDCGVKDAWGNGLTSALTGYLDLGSGVLILYFGGILVYHGEMSVGELVTFQLFWNMMNNAYQNLQGLVTSFTRSAAGAEKVFSLWDSEPDIDPQKGTDIDWDVQGHLQLQDVKFFYQMRPDNIVLNKFNLDIPAGKTVALVGRSGGGKSTLIQLLLRFYDPKEGKLLLDGKEYESLKVNQLRRLFGVVTQETELFAMTVKENIALHLEKDEYTMDDVINAAKKACAHDFICEMKDGYETRIGERGNRLSGGQRQRLAIARVFLRRPRIILLDEATSALDEHSQEAVQEALTTLIAESNATVVLVAHRLSTVQNADSICVIDKGRVLEQGNHEELVAKAGIYASMVEKQLKKKSDLLDQESNKKQSDEGKKKAAADDIDALLSEE